MKSISADLATHLAGECITIATCWKVTRTDGYVFAATTHDNDLIVDAITYTASAGYDRSDAQTVSDLSVDNLDVTGFLSSPAITEDDLRAGLWDFAAVEIFQVNWSDLTQGTLSLRTGTLGQVTVERDQFKVELRGMMQAYTRVLGRLISPSCPWVLGDSRCTKDLTLFTFTGTIEAVNPDGVTLYDSARTEAGPIDVVVITNVSNANPGIVTVADGTDLSDGEAITMSEIIGPDILNQVTIVRNLSGNTFELGIDTSDTGIYPPYVSGGIVTPLGETSGYFDQGKITFDSGANTDISMDIKSSVPGQITLFLPMPYTVEVGDTYTIVAGCDKSLESCKDKFDNVVNFGGFPHLPGIDSIIQVGRQSS